VIAVLADDLTSALDGAAPFAERGLKARVVFNHEALGAAAEHADVLSLDLDSRFSEPAEAERRFRSAGAALAGAALLYKTVDSTLRGNLSAETRGALAGSGRTRAVVAPAFPAAGRTTSGGRQFVNGVPVELTEFARDSRNPVSSSVVVEHFAGLGRAALTVEDAADDSQLDALVSRMGPSRDLLWVGSPGLAAALARSVPAAARARRPEPWPPVRRVLTVVGSQHPANAAQVEALTAAGAAIVRAQAPMSPPLTLAEAIATAFDSVDLVCLLPPQTKVEGVGGGAAELARWLGAAIARSAATFDALVVTGGDTARRLAEALGAQSLDLAGEVEPGVPYGLLRAGERRLPFATKAGGFGDAQTLGRCVNALRSNAGRRP
jgi:uncharacterized protein YgbK (DUF1537 family)